MHAFLSILFDFGTSVDVQRDWVSHKEALLMHALSTNRSEAGHSQFASKRRPKMSRGPVERESSAGTRAEWHNMAFERSSFRRNFQRWVELNYGENSRTKTITRTKYTKICRYLLGEPMSETDAKFRFWVKSKGFRIVRDEAQQTYGDLYVPVKVPSTRVSYLFSSKGPCLKSSLPL